MSGAWGVYLNGAYLTGSCDDQTHAAEGCDLVLPDPVGTLAVPPDGLGMPGLRTEDVTFPQRDGVKHYADWYEARIITLEVTVCPDDDACGDCADDTASSATAREKLRDLSRAWARQCDDVELVIFTNCHGTSEDRSLVGPYGAVGRPRQMQVTWVPGTSGCADVVLRFDATDQRLYVLDECGTPGSGEQCVRLLPGTSSQARCYPKCYTGGEAGDGTGDAWCYDQTSGEEGFDAIAQVGGTECVSPEITLCGRLTDPTVENITTGETVSYSGVIRAEDPCVIIDTEAGTATQGGVSRTHLLTGSTRMQLQPGANDLRLISYSNDDTGYAEACWRDVVVVG